MKIFTKNTDEFKGVDLYAACDCGHPAHVVKITDWGDDELLLSFVNQPMTFTEKLKSVWEILFHSNTSVNEIVLNKESWEELTEKLATHAIKGNNYNV